MASLCPEHNGTLTAVRFPCGPPALARTNPVDIRARVNNLKKTPIIKRISCVMLSFRQQSFYLLAAQPAFRLWVQRTRRRGAKTLCDTPVRKKSLNEKGSGTGSRQRGFVPTNMPALDRFSHRSNPLMGAVS